MEIEAYLRRFVKQGSPVIPVLLRNAPEQPELPIFLEGMTWVNFKSEYFDPMEQLIWGITGVKPKLKQRSSTSGHPSEATASPLPKPKRRIVELKSEKNVDYTKLRDLLAAGEWKEADMETGKVMCQAAGRERQGWLDVEDIDNFPCEDLLTINQLWLHYSDGKFGFSVQKEIYESLGGTKEYKYEVWSNFCDRIGWRKGGKLKFLNYSDLTFNLELAHQAHLPATWLGWWEGMGGENGRSLLSRKDL